MVWQPSTPALIAVSLSSLLLYMLLPASGRAPLAMADISPHAHHAHGAAGSGAAMGIQHGAMGHGDMMMMPMSFEWTFDTILWFKSWHPTDARTWLLSALALAALGVAHEALASYRFSLSRSFAAQKPGALLAHAYLPAPGGGAELAPLGARALHSSLYALNLATGYLLMLAVMTFNVGYFLVVIVSMGAGHLLFFNKPWHLALARVEACCETSAAAHE